MSTVNVAALPDQAAVGIRYLLLDGAQCGGHLAAFVRATWASHAESLFDGVMADGSGDVAPYLVELQEAGAAASACQAISRRCPLLGTVTCIESGLSFDELKTRLQRRFRTALPNGKQMLLRAYDGRVLPHLAGVMTADQKSRFFGLATKWWYVSPELDWQAVQGAVEVQDRLVESLVLSAEQRRALQDACYPYFMIDHFMDTDPDLLDQLAPEERYGFFREVLAMARHYRIDGGPDAALFCTLALVEGRDFYAEPEWRERLAPLASGKQTLKDVLDAHYAVVEEDEA